MSAQTPVAASHPRPRRVLIVSYWFPPFEAVASLRMGKFAQHLIADGWDVRVLTADATNVANLSLEIPRANVIYTPWTDVDRMLENALARMSGRVGRADSPDGAATGTSNPEAAAAPAEPPAWRKVLRRLYQEIVRLPDNRAGWIAPALKAGDEMIAAWRPDVIYATAPPPTSLVVANRLSRRHRIPWIAEFRDLWSEHPYYEYSAARRFLDRMWDQRVLTRAAAIVTVSPIWRPRLEARYGRPAITAMNGFVIEDFPERPPVVPETDGPLRIVYTGHIYQGHRDPTPLFDALRRLRSKPSDVVVEFLGSGVEGLRRLAADAGVPDLVRILKPVDHRQSLAIQVHADVLLHLQWCDPKEEGTIAGKIFDYLGARRPILGIALEDSVVAKILHERSAGLATNDPAKIAEQVSTWLQAKRAGGVQPLPASASAGLDRATQFKKMVELLSTVAGQARATARAAEQEAS
jgi:glycosyltransferase involved in cell wall biosynthesis